MLLRLSRDALTRRRFCGDTLNVVQMINPSWVSKWRGSKVFVLGDVMLDKFVYGHVERISPEAPIPVLHHQSEKAMLGGAANVARNIVALGGHAILVGALGVDPEGDLIAGPLVDGDGIVGRFVRVHDHPTTTKVRYVSGGHQIMRLDIERRLHMGPYEIDTICGWLNDAADEISAVVLSDYAKGVLIPGLVRRVIETSRARGIPVVVDTKTRDVARFAGATIMTPNAAEAASITGVDCTDDRHAEIAAKILYERAKVEAVVLTRGAKGMTIFHPNDHEEWVAHIPTHALEVFDVSGAGDTVVATLALALSVDASIKAAASIGNAAAGIAVGKRGTAPVRARELSTALGAGEGDPKIVDHDGAEEIVADWKARGLKVGFTNGCFDLLHPGHVELLKRSRAVCDRLVVALNTDASVRRLKGDTRPVQSEYARSIVMAALDSVDLVTLFDDDTPLNLIRLLRPDLLIKGADYTIATVVGADFVTAYGGRVHSRPDRRRTQHNRDNFPRKWAGALTPGPLSSAQVKRGQYDGARRALRPHALQRERRSHRFPPDHILRLPRPRRTGAPSHAQVRRREAPAPPETPRQAPAGAAAPRLPDEPKTSFLRRSRGENGRLIFPSFLPVAAPAPC